MRYIFMNVLWFEIIEPRWFMKKELLQKNLQKFNLLWELLLLSELEILCNESMWVGFRFLKNRLKIHFKGVSGVRNHVAPTVFRFDHFWPLSAPWSKSMVESLLWNSISTGMKTWNYKHEIKKKTKKYFWHNFILYFFFLLIINCTDNSQLPWQLSKFI